MKNSIQLPAYAILAGQVGIPVAEMFMNFFAIELLRL